MNGSTENTTPKADKKSKKAKGKKHLPTSKAISTPPISACFGSLSSKKETVKSPEYTTGEVAITPEIDMADRRKTRKLSKKTNNEEQHQSEDEESKEEGEATNEGYNSVEPQTHCGVLPCPVPINNNSSEFATTSYADQMGNVISVINQLCKKVTEIDIAINHDSDGINTRITSMTTQLDQEHNARTKYEEKLQQAEKKINNLQEENEVMRGIMCKHSEQLKVMNDRIAMLTAKSMEKNITISGLKELPKEDCRQVVIDFLKREVEIDAESSEIYVAHRIGNKKHSSSKYDRLMIARCKPELKQRVFRNISNLKEKVNHNKLPYYINKQLPDQIVEQNREIREIVKTQKVKDAELPVKERAKIDVRRGEVFIDGERQEKQMLPVEVDELFPDQQEKEKQDKIKLFTSDTISEDKSTFVAYTYKTGQLHEVRRVYRKIRRSHPNATHVVASYSLKNNRGYQDDGEYGAGHRLLHLLESNYQPNVAVFVVRMYGGRHLGPKRFAIMSDVATEALERAKAEKIK